jgi:DNA-directed RNA polymerase subunit M/transcription elongation factor TFIIS
MAIEKPCRVCKLVKPLEDFSPRKANRDGRTNVCRPCHNEYRLERRVLDSESRRKGYSHHLKARYGLTLEELEAMIERQNGLCEICHQLPTPEQMAYRKTSQGLNVDHDHETGKVRSLLCTPCNTMLGAARDSTDILKWGIEYLYEHR